MSASRDHTFPIIDSILHPTDFSEASLRAFHHALRAALVAHSKLTLFHVASGERDESMDFPAVRETLERWGLLPKDSHRSAVAELGIQVRKSVVQRSKPAEAILHFLEEQGNDLIVLAAHQHESWMTGTVTPRIACRAGQMALFVPEKAPGFVAENGSVTLDSVLVPIAENPPPQPAIEAAARLVSRLERPRGTLTILHMGNPGAMPSFACPEVPGWEWKTVSRTGEVIHGIVETAREIGAQLMVMATDGRRGLLEALRGSHTEVILRQESVPLLIVPVGSTAEANLAMGTR